MIYPSMCLEDLKSADDAHSVGFEKIDDIIFIRNTSYNEESIRNLIINMRSIFISGYIFQGERREKLDVEIRHNDVADFIKEVVVGPLNKLDYKKDKAEVVENDNFFYGVTRIIMLDSMEPIVLILDKESG